MSNNLLVGQSGGPTAVINGSLYGVVSEGLANPAIGKVIGMVHAVPVTLIEHIFRVPVTGKNIMDFTHRQTIQPRRLDGVQHGLGRRL